MYLSPVTLPVPFWLLFFVNLGLNVGWLFAWGYEELTTAAVLLFLLAASNCVTLFILHRRYVGELVLFILHRRQLLLPLDF